MSAQVKWKSVLSEVEKHRFILLNYLLHKEVMLTIIKVFITLFLLCLWKQGTVWHFSKQLSKLSFQLSDQIYALPYQTEGEKKAFSETGKKKNILWHFPQEHLVIIRDEKVCPFVKFEITLPHICFLLNFLTNKHYRTWSSVINLWIYSRICRKLSILLSARQRSDNYWERFKENVLGNMLMSYWPWFTWNFFMTWFHKMLKLTFKSAVMS